MVVKDGELVSKTEERTSAAAARSMVGVKEDGTLVICMNDGRGANNSVGFCNYEEGEAMLALGCKWAANCDGGGSSAFLTKRVGEETFTMRSIVNRNNPKEGYRVYTFGEDGKLLDEMLDANGIITSEVDGMFWVVNGKTAYGGLMLIDGDYYYARTSGQLVVDKSYWITKTNDLLPAANYTFGADGRMIDPPAA